MRGVVKHKGQCSDVGHKRQAQLLHSHHSFFLSIGTAQGRAAGSLYHALSSSQGSSLCGPASSSYA